jgi:hypothetical protein
LGKYKAKKEELEKEMLLLQERLKDLEKTNLDYYDLGVNLLELCRKAKILYENATFQEKQDLIHLAFQKILIKDKAISFEYSPWFAILKKHSGLIKEICELEKDKILQGENANFEKIHSEMLAYILDLRRLDSYNISQLFHLFGLTFNKNSRLNNFLKSLNDKDNENSFGLICDL